MKKVIVGYKGLIIEPSTFDKRVLKYVHNRYLLCLHLGKNWSLSQQSKMYYGTLVHARST
jgi:hypothetical protein